MRNAQKKDILKIINTLHQAQDEVKKCVESKQYISAQDMIIQCQECAISIGMVIEKSEGTECVAIPYIEEYCDFLYHAHEELASNSDTNANKIYKALRKPLLKIENSIKHDIPIRKEVVFFPYKASMWDALESVYLAAKAEPNCDAYCVPIPYYNKNPDGSFGQLHYEGLEYPQNVEVIDWQIFNFEERNPDAIYIHNAYDDWNLVTCVHPRFFSKNLKEHTDELIYIPYFVLDEIEPDNQTAIDGMKHFCFLPGIINADKVIVQSEKMKQIYVNEYIKAAQLHGLSVNHLDRKKLEEKFLGLGSPKFDKISNIKRENVKIPDEWLKVIQKPDGSWKKIIFYNTSIAGLLNYNEKMLAKMELVFDTFKENRNEVALLWRPHPLIKATVSSMRPQLWTDYDRIARKYKEEGWGIYDDTADLDRAIIISDAYYGDGSSVVQLYKMTGKAVVIQDPDLLDNQIYYYDIDIKDNKAWIPIYGTDIICNMDMECRKISSIQNAQNLEQSKFYEGIYKTREGVLLSQNQDGKKLFYFDEKNSNNNYTLQLEYDVTLAHDRVFEYNNCLYIFPLQAIIIKLNILTREVNYFLYKDVAANEYLSKPIARNKNDIYILKNDKSGMFVFCLESDKLDTMDLGYKGNFETICVGKDDVWFTDESELVNYNLHTKKIESRKINFKEKNQIEHFYRSFFFDRSVWLIPTKINYIVKYDIDKKVFTCINCPVTNHVSQRKNSYRYISAITYKNSVLLLDCSSEEIYELNMVNEEIVPFNIKWDVNLLSYGYMKEGNLRI